jgi:hypothetical protein
MDSAPTIPTLIRALGRLALAENTTSRAPGSTQIPGSVAPYGDWAKMAPAQHGMIVQLGL